MFNTTQLVCVKFPFVLQLIYGLFSFHSQFLKLMLSHPVQFNRYVLNFHLFFIPFNEFFFI